MVEDPREQLAQRRPFVRIEWREDLVFDARQAGLGGLQRDPAGGCDHYQVPASVGGVAAAFGVSGRLGLVEQAHLGRVRDRAARRLRGAGTELSAAVMGAVSGARIRTLETRHVPTLSALPAGYRLGFAIAACCMGVAVVACTALPRPSTRRRSPGATPRLARARVALRAGRPG